MNRLTGVLVRCGFLSLGLGLLVFSLVSGDDTERTATRTSDADILKELEGPVLPRSFQRSGDIQDASQTLAKRLGLPNTEAAEPAPPPAYKSTKPVEYGRATPAEQSSAFADYKAAQPAEPVEYQGRTAIATRDAFSRRQLPQPAGEASPEPRFFEKPPPPLVTSAAFAPDPRLGNGDRVLEPAPPLPEHRPYDLARGDVTPASPVPAASSPDAGEPKPKLAVNGAISFLADLLQPDKPEPSAWQTARAPGYAAEQAAALSNAPAAQASVRPRKSAVVRWEPAACDKGQRFWER